jgi:hypothetical protein
MSLSFNDEGPLGTLFRYIGDTATYIARYDDLFTGKDEKIDLEQGPRLDERHRAAGPRILRRHAAETSAQFERRAGAADVAGCWISWRANAADRDSRSGAGAIRA